MSDPLIDALATAERRAVNGYDPDQCQACDAIRDASTSERKEALQSALAGKIGADKLSAILKGQGINVGRRHIRRHREEGHRP